jgi:hypothetical protein
MRKPLVALLFASALVIGALPSEAAPLIPVGSTIKFSDSHGTTGGGEFILTVNNSFSFISFCLQRTQYIDFTHNFKVDSVTGYATFDPVANGGNIWGRDYLSQQTAYLYTMFSQGTLTGYKFTGTTAQRVASANALQNAIWMFENELAMDTNNQFVQLANAAVSSGAWKGFGNVKVLNLSLNGVGAQDQLVIQVPGPSALVLLGSALGLFAAVRRRNRRLSL